MARKKIVFIIVEGPSDEVALGAVLSKLFDSSSVYVHIMFGDITTRSLTGNKTIVSSIGDVVKTYANSKHFKKSDFQEIIHIADTDGAFIPNDSVVEDEQKEEVFYSEKEIRTKYKTRIEKRNETKSRHMQVLCSRKKVWDIPYRLFYMSCNLDHVLYGKLNSTDEEKENDSYDFAMKYRLSPGDFVKFISESDFSVMTGYKDSWEYIQQELRSLERHTNLGLCFSDDAINTGNRRHDKRRKGG